MYAIRNGKIRTRPRAQDKFCILVRWKTALEGKQKYCVTITKCKAIALTYLTRHHVRFQFYNELVLCIIFVKDL